MNALNLQRPPVHHITPLRIRSVSKEKPPQDYSLSRSSLTSRPSAGELALDYIGLRGNRGHAACNNQHY
jgi:hypothetical protein